MLLAITIASLVVTGAALIATPALSEPTVPLGVRVPARHVRDPLVRRSVRAFQGWCAALTLLACGIAAWWRSPEGLPLVVLLLGLLAAGMAVWAQARLPLLRAKRAGAFDEGGPVPAASLTDHARRASSRSDGHAAEPERPRWSLHAGASALALTGLAIITVRYPDLPDPYPTHWTATGQADAWSDLTWGVALMPSLLALGMAVLLAGLAQWMARRPDLGGTTNRGDSGQLVLGVTNLVVVGAFTGIAVVPALGGSGTAVMVIGIAVVLAVAALLVWTVVSARRARRPDSQGSRPRRRSTRPASAVEPEPDDDDHLWKWGLFYVNRADRSLIVPARAGYGLDLNFGNPWALAFVVGAGVIVSGAVIGALLVA